WPDAARIDTYIRHSEAAQNEEQAFAHFPTWMWRNQEVHAFVDWLRTHNTPLKEDARVEFRGLDVYSLANSIAAVLAYLDKVDPEGAKDARRRYGCLTPWQHEPQHYGHRAMMGADTCEDAVAAQLTELLNKRMAYKDGEAYFDAEQNARIVRAAEEYYRIMYHGSTDSWNLRDRHMFDTLQALLRRRPKSKAIVWAHNTHIGNAAATSMGWQGEFNIGELCRTAYGDDCIAIGFGTDSGTVAAASEWDEPMDIKRVTPVRDDSYEHLFRSTGIVRSLTDWRTRNENLRPLLGTPRTERAIGVIYRPDTEYLSHYFQTVLSEQFDAYVWFEQTKAITPLDETTAPTGGPDTYPFGL
ncbi:MAG: erythromycin esterase family protein, partial [Alphaproteobacteria bacterium]|nr:erythromycin esterase family protein [Alphaproteobacteria bacterium]